MLGHIARKEFREVLRDGRFRWTSAMIVALLGIGMVTGWHGYRTRTEERREAERHSRRTWVEQGRKNPHIAAHFGVYVFKVPSALSFFEPGIDPYTGATLYLEAHRQNQPLFQPASDGAVLQRFGELTPAAIAQVLLPLAIILFCFQSFSVERERGTLQQLASLGVPARVLVSGKLIGLGGALMLLLVPAAVAASGIVLLQVSPGESTLLRVAMLCCGYLLYLAVFVLLSLVGSAVAKTSRIALMALLGFWIWNSIVAPRIFADLAGYLYPPPSSAEFSAAARRDLERGIDGASSGAQRNQAVLADLMVRYNVDRVEDLPVNPRGFLYQASEERAAQVWDKHFGALWLAYERQDRLQQWAALLAPMLAVRSVSMGAAAADFHHSRDFARAAEQYRREMVKALNLEIAIQSRHGEQYEADRSLWERIPEFAYKAPGIRFVLRKIWIDVLTLAAWVALSGVLVYRGADSIKVIV
ncbi:MAG: DUF3526 domain-containing protein [Bryobacteraceae bacterium]